MVVLTSSKPIIEVEGKVTTSTWCLPLRGQAPGPPARAPPVRRRDAGPAGDAPDADGADEQREVQVRAATDLLGGRSDTDSSGRVPGVPGRFDTAGDRNGIFVGVDGQEGGVD